MSADDTPAEHPGVAGPAVDFDPAEVDLFSSFLDACDRHGSATAVLDGEVGYTFNQVEGLVLRLRDRLAAAGLTRGDCVYVCADRGIEEILAVLAVLAAGATFVALRHDSPPAVLEHQVRTIRGRMAMHDGNARNRLFASRISAASDSGTEILAITAGGPEVAPVDEPRPIHRPRATGSAEGLIAYVGFTSGSTGSPKAVRIPQRAVARLAAPGGQREISCGPGCSMLRLAPLAFDASTLELFLPLLNGGRLVIGPPEPASLSALRELLMSGAITHLWLTAGLMRVFARRAPEAFGAVTHLLTGGDVVPAEAVKRLLETNKGLRVTNGYGPTENTTFTTLAHFDSPSQCTEPLPIGRPIAGGGVLIVDERLRPLPFGAEGQIAVWGLGLARDYWNDPELTAARFVELAGVGRGYLTGDLGLIDAAGCLHYRGRHDGQVKVRGMRIETDGVRQAILSLPGVTDAVVFPEPDADAASRRLIAAVIPENAAEFSLAAVRAAVAERLSRHELPQLWCQAEAFPLMDNHKLDLRRLLAMAMSQRRLSG